jgi:UDP-N-acetylmuramyl pentapeptide phosphotransferase/UDP-N-acetylglucosamine-1-phosphate transferase
MTVFLFIFFVCVSYIIFLNNFYVSKNFLLDKPLEVDHKSSSSKNLPQIGGIYLFTTFLTVSFFFKIKIIKPEFFFFFFLLTILGIYSDYNHFFKASKRFLYQLIIVILFIFFFNLKINNTQIYFINYLININIIVNYFFTAFCILILINGTNFTDGKNGLVIGNYILIFFFYYMLLKSDPGNKQLLDFLKYLILILLALFLFNIFGFCLLGDNGNYFLSFFTAVFVISFFNSYSSFNPIVVLNLLWYPAFENFFSILRRYFQKKKIFKPDKLHFHNLLNLFIIRLFKMKQEISTTNNTTTGVLINIFLFIFLLISYLVYPSTVLLVLCLCLAILFYLIFYFYFIYYLKK